MLLSPGKPMRRAGTRSASPHRPAEVKQGLLRLGPAFVAAVAYVDPGNIATNTTAGARYGFALTWVIVLAIAAAGPVQYLSAKLGAVTGRSMPELLGARLGGSARLLYWLQAEGVAVATDLAEVVGAGIALHLLLALPMWAGAVIAALIGGALMIVRDRVGERAFQRVMILGLAMIGAGFVLGVALGPAPGHLDLRPHLAGAEMVLLATGIVGATVMPHAIYLHSALTTEQTGRVRNRLWSNRIDVVLAMVLAGAVNLSMLVLGATALRGHSDDDFGALVDALGARVGAGAQFGFLIALLVSGLTSTAVGVRAGEVVMAGLLRRRVPVSVRRVAVLLPAVLLLAAGIPPVELLVWFQVALAIGLPFALVPLVRLTASRSTMGHWVNSRTVSAVCWLLTGSVIALDLGLFALSFARV